MMKWLAANAAWILSILAIGWIAYALARAVTAAWKKRHRPSVTEEFERTEKVRQQIRRKIADRKANPIKNADAGSTTQAATKPSRGLRPIDPFGGPTRQWWARVRRWFGRDQTKLVKVRS